MDDGRNQDGQVSLCHELCLLGVPRPPFRLRVEWVARLLHDLLVRATNLLSAQPIFITAANFLYFVASSVTCVSSAFLQTCRA
jgi:hypothetical protein